MSNRNVTVVSGASTGIGEAIALRQARAGDHVWALVRNPESCANLRDAAEREHLLLELCEADVTDSESVRAAIQRVVLESGRIDRFVCNAGIFIGATFESLSIVDHAEVFDVNYFGALRVILEILPTMRMQRSGTIVAVSSQSSEVVLPTWAAYSASKRALETALEALALEVGLLGIRIALVQPGSTRTEMRKKISERTNHSDYSIPLSRYRDIVMADRETSIEADQVAGSVENLLHVDNPPWRTRVGSDAIRNTTKRQAAGDDRWVGFFQISEEASFRDAWGAPRSENKRIPARPDGVTVTSQEGEVRR